MPVFISHSHEDAAFYSALCLAIDGASVPRYDTKTLAPGLSLGEQLRKVIDKCEVCVFMATDRSIKSPWCLAELGAFWGAGKRTIVYLADPNLNEDEIPPQFQGNLRTTSAIQLVEAVRDALKDGKTKALPVDLLPIEYLRPLGDDAGHEKDHIRLACAHTLWSFRPDRAKGVLEDQLGDWSDAVRRHARFLLDLYKNDI